MPKEQVGNFADLMHDKETSSPDWIDKSFKEFESNQKLQLKVKMDYIRMAEHFAKQENLSQLEEQLSNLEKGSAAYIKKETEIQNAKDNIIQKAQAVAEKRYEQRYKSANNKEKAEMLKKEEEIQQQKLADIEEELQDKLAAATTEEQREKALQEYNEEKLKTQKEINDLQFKQHELNKTDSDKVVDAMFDASQEKLIGDKIGGMLKAAKGSNPKDMKESFDKSAKESKEELKLLKDQKKLLDTEKKQLQDEYKQMEEAGASEEELLAKQQEIAEQDAKIQDNLKKQKEVADKANFAELGSKICEKLDQLKGDYEKAFKEAEDMLTTYMGHIDARLQGSEKSYDDVMNRISNNLSVNPYVRTQDVIEKMKDAVDQGIVYNLEQRAFLKTISDKIANTFDAFDSNLTRLIRLQQADSTAARLGMEATLTKFLNKMFEDSSYLNKAADDVSQTLVEASAMLDKTAATEFEYVVQKWLGSMYSLGMSDSTINNLAQAVKYVATGDVNNLANNNQLQTLVAMSASRAGLEYSKLLLQGLNAEDTNTLLASMVSYLKEIAENSDNNNVIKAAYGDIFSVSMADMKAITNFTPEDIEGIYNTNVNYEEMFNETQDQLNSLYKRVNISTMLSTVYKNALFGVASDMVNNVATYAMTKMLDFMDSSGIEFNIPAFSVMGNMVDLDTSLQKILRLGVGATQAFSIIGTIASGIGSRAGLDLDDWGATDRTKRGNLGGFTSGDFISTSGSIFVNNTQSGNVLDTNEDTQYTMNSSSSDMELSSLTSATDKADETSKITNKNNKTEYTFDDFYSATIGESAPNFVRTEDINVKQTFLNPESWLSVRDTELLKLRDDTNTSLKVTLAAITDAKHTEEGYVKVRLDKIQLEKLTPKELPKWFNTDTIPAFPVKNETENKRLNVNTELIAPITNNNWTSLKNWKD